MPSLLFIHFARIFFFSSFALVFKFLKVEITFKLNSKQIRCAYAVLFRQRPESYPITYSSVIIFVLSARGAMRYIICIVNRPLSAYTHHIILGTGREKKATAWNGFAPGETSGEGPGPVGRRRYEHSGIIFTLASLNFDQAMQQKGAKKEQLEGAWAGVVLIR